MADDPSGRALARALATFLRTVTDDDVRALERGEARIVVERKATRQPRGAARRRDIDWDGLREKLVQAASREEGLALLEEFAPLRDQLKELARRLDLPTPKSDNVERLRDRIVDTTIGYRLRSNAIRSSDSNPS